MTPREGQPVDPYEIIEDPTPEDRDAPAREEPAAVPAFAMRPPPEVTPGLTVENNPAGLRLGPAWLLMLFVRPDIYFRRFERGRGLLVTALLLIVFAVSTTAGRIDYYLLQFPKLSDTVSSWAVYWFIAGVGSVFVSALVVGLGGSWYWARLWMSGDRTAPWDQAVRMYVHAGMVHSLPHIVTMLVVAAVFATPTAWVNGDTMVLDIVLLSLPLWSIVVSFIGVRTVFDTRLGWAILWFLVLPIITLLIALTLIFGLAVLMQTGSPATERALRHEAPGIAFEYPGNWWIDLESDLHDPQFDVSITMWDDAWMRVMLYESEDELREELQKTLDMYSTLDVVFVSDTTQNGPWTGYGETYETDLGGETFLFESFVTDVGDGYLLEFVRLYPRDMRTKLGPGFDHVIGTTRIDTSLLPEPVGVQEF